jgi:shikimate kinase
MNDPKPHPSLPPDAPNLYLIGFMGTGKSVVGQKVAALLNLPFMDSDKMIEENEGMAIPEIFERLGELHFRALERKFILEDQPRYRTVISCGGGLVTNPELLDIIKKAGVVIVLYASVETLLKRTGSDSNRPLMKTDDPEKRIRDLLEQRESIYKEAGVGIMTDGHSIAKVAEHVIRIYLDKVSGV